MEAPSLESWKACCCHTQGQGELRSPHLDQALRGPADSYLVAPGLATVEKLVWLCFEWQGQALEGWLPLWPLGQAWAFCKKVGAP